MKRNKTLVILAAGLGSRYGSLKQMDRIGPSGETLLEYSAFDAIRAGFNKIVFVIRKETENEFIELLAGKIAVHADLEFVFQELDDLPDGFRLPESRVKPWGTGHAILATRKKINECFAVINADDFYGRSSFILLSNFLDSDDALIKNDFAMAGYSLAKTLSEFGSVSRGVCSVTADQYLLNITEKTAINRVHDKIVNKQSNGETENLSPEAVVSMNCWGFTPVLFDHLYYFFENFLKSNINNHKAEFYIPFVVNDLIKSGQHRVKVLPATNEWFGMTYKEDRQIAVEKINQMVKQGIYADNLWK